MKNSPTWAKRILKFGLISLGTILLLIVGINFWVVGSTNRRIFTEVDSVPQTNAALLLGTSRHTAVGLNAFFFNRIEAATVLYKQGKVRKIIVSGDNGKLSYNETEAMKRELMKRGIPERDIIPDHAGFRTLDSVVRSKSVFDQDRIIVVSQRFHLQRALFIARAKGLDATGYVANDPLHGWPYYRVMIREYFARVKAVLDCYLIGTQPKFPGPKQPIVFD